jgi:hypothetical protein
MGPLLPVSDNVNGLNWAHCCWSDTPPMALSGPIAVCSPDMLMIALNGPIVALETDCQWPQVGLALLLSDADNGIKWAHYYSSGILLIVAATVWPSSSSSLSSPLLPSHDSDHYHCCVIVIIDVVIGMSIGCDFNLVPKGINIVPEWR